MAGNTGIKGGYWLAQQATILPSERIPVSCFTHVFYAFVGVDPGTGALRIPQQDEEQIENFVDRIHRDNRKAILSIGGPKSSAFDPSIDITTMASERGKRTAFINSTIQASERFRFDGFDLAWEFPRTQDEMNSLGLLIEEWRQQIRSRQPALVLAATVRFSPVIPKAPQPIKYPAAAINANLDFINLILYNYTPVTCGPARFNVDPYSIGNSANGISSWTEAGVGVTKLAMGIPLFGNKWLLADIGDNGIGAPVAGYNGQVPYSQINGANNGTFDPVTRSQYVAEGTTWYGYEGAQSIADKISHAKQNNLVGGYFLYPLGYEDSGHTLSRAASDAWGRT
ncbi:1,4-alpha-glucan-branching enzyme [Trema orientale]|uniref:1,4-alpha-glucan-branching enzyme n=1 Tax=Trema orientale TaxID=63057 RepID=A0A2P5C8I4_TREOI|nr:1,4-alpha-glucan-branching enzyme [Trema orientale]